MRQNEAPPGQCRQCWHHAHVLHNIWSSGYVPSKGDCQECITCAASDHSGKIVPKKESSWR